MSVRWERWPTKATCRDASGRLRAEVETEPEGWYATPCRLSIYTAAGRLVDRRGCTDVDDGIGMARAILAVG